MHGTKLITLFTAVLRILQHPPKMLQYSALYPSIWSILFYSIQYYNPRNITQIKTYIYTMYISAVMIAAVQISCKLLKRSNKWS